MPVEVEKKFSVRNEDIERLIVMAEFLSEKTFTDTYWDNSSYSLTTKDIWLRSRDGRFELKLSLNQGKSATTRAIDRYEEIDSEEEIRKALNIRGNRSLAQDLEEDGYRPSCTIKTTRRKYKKGEFVIDIDIMDYGYSIGEIELIVDDPSESNTALKRITFFAEEQGLSLDPVLGKVPEFLRRTNPKHFQALVDAGVI